MSAKIRSFAEIELLPRWREKQIEQALVQRMTDTWGEGCAIATVPLHDDFKRWSEIGFQKIDSPNAVLGAHSN